MGRSLSSKADCFQALELVRKGSDQAIRRLREGTPGVKGWGLKEGQKSTASGRRKKWGASTSPMTGWSRAAVVAGTTIRAGPISAFANQVVPALGTAVTVGTR